METKNALLAVLQRQHDEACSARHWDEAERIAAELRRILGVTNA